MTLASCYWRCARFVLKTIFLMFVLICFRRILLNASKSMDAVTWRNMAPNNLLENESNDCQCDSESISLCHNCQKYSIATMPFLLSTTSKPKQKHYPQHQKCGLLSGDFFGLKLWMRRKLVAKMVKFALFLVLFATIGINVFFIMETTKKLSMQSMPKFDQEPMEPKSHVRRFSNGLKLQESSPKSLSVEVLSSRNKVSVAIDGTTVRTTAPWQKTPFFRWEKAIKHIGKKVTKNFGFLIKWFTSFFVFYALLHLFRPCVRHSRH